MAQLDFTPAEIEPDTRSFDPVPPGDYTCQIIESEVKPTSRGDGTILKLVSEIVEGPHANRRIFDNLNIQNPNPEAERISKQRLRALCDAIGIAGHVSDSEVLHYKHFTGRVTVKPAEGQYGPKNEIRYRPLAGSTPQAQAQAQPNVQPIRAAAPAPAQAAPAGRPWVKPAR